MVADGKPVIGGWVGTPAPLVGELLGALGFDAVAIDLQHAMLGIEAAIPILQAISATPAVPLVRVSGNHFAEINKVLDAGAYGVICPLVNSVEDAQRFVDAMRYPPAGSRSFGPVRGLLYGGPDYYERANDTVLAFAMVETRQALAVVDRIAAVPGIDGIFVGPNDLAISLGLGPGAPWKTGALADALARIVDAARKAGRMSAIWVPGTEMAADMYALGFNITFPAADMVMLRAEAAKRLAALRATGVPAQPKAVY
jgi:4-hydroxy-2-oxoheptanedioate aldolase